MASAVRGRNCLHHHQQIILLHTKWIHLSHRIHTEQSSNVSTITIQLLIYYAKTQYTPAVWWEGAPRQVEVGRVRIPWRVGCNGESRVCWRPECVDSQLRYVKLEARSALSYSGLQSSNSHNFSLSHKTGRAKNLWSTRRLPGALYKTNACQEQGLVLKNVGLVVVEPGKRATDVEEGFARSEFEPLSLIDKFSLP